MTTSSMIWSLLTFLASPQEMPYQSTSLLPVPQICSPPLSAPSLWSILSLPASETSQVWGLADVVSPRYHKKTRVLYVLCSPQPLFHLYGPWNSTCNTWACYKKASWVDLLDFLGLIFLQWFGPFVLEIVWHLGANGYNLNCRSICLGAHTVEHRKPKMTKVCYSLLQRLVYTWDPVQCFGSRWNLQMISRAIPSCQNGYPHTLLMEIELSTWIDSYLRWANAV